MNGAIKIGLQAPDWWLCSVTCVCNLLGQLGFLALLSSDTLCALLVGSRGPSYLVG
ncbi:protein of unknown function [Candidatus Filomicrobium marinum]|uniref:Uncharacterized protein n=1 Tax=Candidatus Filomicrobium marinum TaxID=1608628 RepID=A0A0D6JBC8_9HYPH|nr:protein of unknown function [Candidatus Filomicrobium marinum]CPR15604.1 protein of unknown function [Candidatus Filomicrobium marinum]